MPKDKKKHRLQQLLLNEDPISLERIPAAFGVGINKQMYNARSLAKMLKVDEESTVPHTRKPFTVQQLRDIYTKTGQSYRHNQYGTHKYYSKKKLKQLMHQEGPQTPEIHSLGKNSEGKVKIGWYLPGLQQEFRNSDHTMSPSALATVLEMHPVTHFSEHIPNVRFIVHNLDWENRRSYKFVYKRAIHTSRDVARAIRWLQRIPFVKDLDHGSRHGLRYYDSYFVEHPGNFVMEFMG